MLGNGFPAGDLNEQLFSGVFTGADFLADIDFWKLANGNAPITVQEEFFVWLGVNRRTRIRREIRNFERWADDGYVRYVFNAVGRPDYESYKKYEVSSVYAIEQILNSDSFSKEHCLAWIITDPTLHGLLRDDANGESFSYTYNGITTQVYKKPSYFKYQLTQAETFAKVVADEEVARQLGLHWINLKHELFSKLNISESTIIDTLRQLGAVTSFAQLSPDHIFKLLKDCGQQAGSPRKLYELALAYFKQRESEDFSKYLSDLKVWATRGGSRHFMPSREVYYTDNATLPEHMLSEYWIFDFPRKRGAPQISKAFSINTFKSLKIELQGTPVTHQANRYFQNWVETIKPYLLTYRLNNLREDAAGRRDVTSLHEDGIGGIDSAAQLKKLNILVCASATYTVNDGSPKQLLPGEFIPLGDRNYCLCADVAQYMEEWKQSPVFCEAFAEILCMLFDTQKNKEDFKAVFKDNGDLRHTTYNIEAASLFPVLEEARSLLGLAAEETAFWKAVLAAKQFELPAYITSRKALYGILLSELQYDHKDADDIDYTSWSTLASYKLLKKLHEQTGIMPSAIYLADSKFTGLEAWHYQQFHKISFNFEQPWIFAWWKLMSGKSEKKQRGFLSECQKYNGKAEAAAVMLSRTHAFNLSINHSDLLLAELNTVSGLKLTTKGNKHAIVNYYTHLLEAADLLQEELTLEIQSLLFFEGNNKIIEEAIESILTRKRPTHAPTPSPNKPTAPTPRNPIQFTSFDSGRLTGGVSVSNRPGRTPGTYSGGNETRKNAAGQRAEEIVYSELKASYPVVQWLSRYSTDLTINKDDLAGYDMRYKLDDNDDSEWYYVEVKSSSEDNFIISRNEVEFALMNTQHYQLAIVQNGIIYLDRQFFCDKDRIANFTSLSSNPGIKPTHFEVAWKIS
ncbi:MAG: DUF3883 domain-containing protein [Sphingobacteriales bacterium]|nr:MAG: DUF3883 domain-containing protein [Sphingobacteriales bacterium]